MRKYTHRKKSEVSHMGYYQDQFGRLIYQPDIQPQTQPPMDRLAQLQAQRTVAQPQQPNQSLLYVQGEAAAKSWMVGAGQSVLLMDSESPVFYIKSADASGIPLPLRVFDYKERAQATLQNTPQATQNEQIDLDSKYVTRGEYDALQGKYMEILERLNSFPVSNSGSDTTKRTEKTNNNARSKGGNANE